MERNPTLLDWNTSDFMCLLLEILSLCPGSFLFLEFGGQLVILVLYLEPQIHVIIPSVPLPPTLTQHYTLHT